MSHKNFSEITNIKAINSLVCASVALNGSRYIRAYISIMFVFFVVSLLNQVHADSLPAFVSPKFMHVTIVADNMVFNGMQMKSATFESSSNIDKLKEFYQREWRGGIKESLVADNLILSHFDNKFLYVVQINIPQQNLAVDKTYGLLSISKPSSLPSQLNLGNGFPLMSSSRVVNDITSYDLGKRGRTLLFYNHHSIDENLKYYRSKLTREGWIELKQRTQSIDDNSQALIMNNGGNELNMAFSNIGDRTNVVAISVEK